MNKYLRHIAILFVFLTGVPGNVSGNDLRLDYISYLEAFINDFQYVINTRKASVDQVKDAFKELFVDKKCEIYNAMKPELKSSLEFRIDCRFNKF